MTEVLVISQSGKSITVDDSDMDGTYNRHIGYEKFELMQFIGRKDKNGFEIFEGDVVKSILTSQYSIDRGKHEQIMVVEHDDCNPCFVLVDVTNKDRREYDFIQCGLRSNEVIGNIYQNPELLNNKER